MFDGRINLSISSSDWRSNCHRVRISRETPVPLAAVATYPFFSLAHVRAELDRWRQDYNTVRSPATKRNRSQ